MLSVVGCGKPARKLDVGYKAAAEDLRKRVDAALLDPANQSMILQKTHAAEEAYENAGRLADRKIGKTHWPTAYLSGKVVLNGVSTAPVDLKQDDPDAAARFTAAAVLTYKTEGQEDILKVAVPVSADANEKWTFPDTAEVIRLTKDEFDAPAAALLDRAK